MDTELKSDPWATIGIIFFIFALLFGIVALPDSGDEQAEGCAPASKSSAALPLASLDLPVVRDVVALVVPESVRASLCVDTLTKGNGTASSPLEEVTPQGPLSGGGGAGAGSSAKDPHDAAAAGLAAGQGTGGDTNTLNPEAPTQPQQAGHTDTSAAPPPSVIAQAPQQQPCDSNDPDGGCFVCDPEDPDNPCYQDPHSSPSSTHPVCDPYDPHAPC